MEYVRLGLGESVESVDLAVDPGGNGGALKIKYRDYDAHVPASVLSDGTLAYLAIVAVFRLNRDRSFLAWDEPDLHLHPGLTARVVEMLESAGAETNVVVATHSDRFLDALSAPAQSVQVMETGANISSQMRRLDANALSGWMEDDDGVGSICSAGHLRSILCQDADASRLSVE
jgi:predicted ATPase